MIVGLQQLIFKINFFKIKYFFIGNICRSPIAEAVFAKHIKENKLQNEWEVDSAALIGYHTGKGPDNRAMKTLKNRGITDYSHKARTVSNYSLSNL